MGKVDATSAVAADREVRRIYWGLFGNGRFRSVESVLDGVARLFAGDYAGYQRCDARYHDQEHTLQAYLATARIFDGMLQSDRGRMSADYVALGLISTLGHDAGFIKIAGDEAGHGGKYTLTHAERSRQFMSSYLPGLGFSAYDCTLCISVG